MIEMWDEIFSKQNSSIGKALSKQNGDKAFELMNKELDKVWKEVYRVLEMADLPALTLETLQEKLVMSSNYIQTIQEFEYCIEVRL